MIICPDCDSEDVSGLENYSRSEQDQIIEYVCRKCGCEFEQKTTIEITKHGSRHTNEEA